MKRIITTVFIAFTLLASPAMAQAPGDEQQRHVDNGGPDRVHNDHRNDRKDHRKGHREHRRNHKEHRHDEHHE